MIPVTYSDYPNMSPLQVREEEAVCDLDSTALSIGSERFAYFLRKAKEGDSQCMFQIGRCYQEGTGVKKNQKRAFAWFERGSKNGNTWCEYELAHCYRKGRGTPQNLVVAFIYFK